MGASRRARVWHQQELHLVDPVRPGCVPDGALLVPEVDGQAVGVLAAAHVDHEPGVGHREVGELSGDRVAERGGGVRPAAGELRGVLRERGTQLLALGMQLGGAVLVAVELEQARGGLGGPGQHRVDIAAVGAGERRQRGPALLDRGEPRRVGLDPVGVARALRRDVGDQVADLLQPGGEAGERRVVCGDLVQGPARLRQEDGHVGTSRGRPGRR